MHLGRILTLILKTAAKQLGCENYEKMGTHTLPKSAWSYLQSGTTACPLFAATCMQAEHSLGNVKDRYFVYAAVDLLAGFKFGISTLQSIVQQAHTFAWLIRLLTETSCMYSNCS